MDLSGSMHGSVGGLLAVTVHESQSTGHYEYDFFGNTTVQTGTKKGHFGHFNNTKRIYPKTGLNYYGYRYYDPVTGRWPSRDPIEEKGGYNLYGFVGNDSINRLDILGLDSPGCDGIPDLSPCMKEVCAQHDKCYRDNECTSKSWFAIGGPCSQCNFKAVLGMIKCLGKLCYDDPEKPNYYDAVTNSFFNDPKDPRAWNTTDKIKPPKRKRCKCVKRRIKYPTRR